VIPAFAVGRTQELLYYLRIVKEKNLVSSYPGFEVFVDSPLAVQATSIFGENVESCFDDEAKALVARGIDPIKFPGVKLSVTSDDSKAINGDQKPKVILSASGMCEAGRIRHHLKHNLWRAESSIVFCGYQANGTLGRRLQDGVQEVKLFGESIDVKAEIVTIDGVSGHADKDGLLHWITSFRKKPKRTFIVHGEDSVCTGFAEELQKEYGILAYAPYSGTIFDLSEERFEYEADPVLSQSELTGKKRARTVFNRLVSAGSRLLSVIQKNKGLSNKDAAKFTDQINSLCDKWDNH
jgi:metallo-beta-lactamase family protein